MIARLDYDAGNIKSVEKAFGILGKETVLTRDFHVIEKADHLVLPGVGSFADAMNHLKKFELDKAIKDYVNSDKPFIGICLGLQLLFESSEESPGVEGLHLLDGVVKRIPDALKHKNLAAVLDLKDRNKDIDNSISEMHISYSQKKKKSKNQIDIILQNYNKNIAEIDKEQSKYIKKASNLRKA